MLKNMTLLKLYLRYSFYRQVSLGHQSASASFSLKQQQQQPPSGGNEGSGSSNGREQQQQPSELLWPPKSWNGKGENTSSQAGEEEPSSSQRYWQQSDSLAMDSIQQQQPLPLQWLLLLLTKPQLHPGEEARTPFLWFKMRQWTFLNRTLLPRPLLYKTSMYTRERRRQRGLHQCWWLVPKRKWSKKKKKIQAQLWTSTLCPL